MSTPLCSRCNRRPRIADRTECERCREQNRAYYAARSQGRCVKRGCESPAAEGGTRCEAHRRRPVFKSVNPVAQVDALVAQLRELRAALVRQHPGHPPGHSGQNDEVTTWAAFRLAVARHLAAAPGPVRTCVIRSTLGIPRGSFGKVIRFPWFVRGAGGKYAGWTVTAAGRAAAIANADAPAEHAPVGNASEA